MAALQVTQISPSKNKFLKYKNKIKKKMFKQKEMFKNKIIIISRLHVNTKTQYIIKISN